MNNNISTEGYKRTSPDKNRNFNFIPSGNITMQGVDKPLTLIPVINGKPIFDRKVIANPGDPDIDFGEVDGVLELPMAQANWGIIGGNPFNKQKSIMNNLGTPELTFGNVSDYQNYTPVTQTPVSNELSWERSKQPWEMYNTGLDESGNLRANQISPDLNTPPLQTDNGFSFDPMKQFNPNIQKEFGDIDYNNETPQQREQRMIADANQNQLDDNSKQSEKNRGFYGAINPYGGFNLDNASVYLGASIANKNPLGIATSGAKVGLGVLRNVFSGIGAMRRFNEATTEQQEQMRKDAENRDLIWAQKGGKLLTQSAISGNPAHPNPSAEVEGGEYLQTPDGQVTEVIGKRHSEGGELIDAPNGTKVISDYVKIGAPLAKMFKKEFGLNVVAGSTFATVIDRYSKKIGLDKIIDEEASLINKVSDQEEVKNDTVRDLNLEILSKKLNEVYSRKEPLDEELSKFTNLVFEKQESKKEVDDSKFKKQEGGEIEDPMERALKDYAQSQGLSMDDLMGKMQEMSPEEQEAFIREIMGTEEPTANPQGQNDDLESIITAYSQLVGVDPQTLAQDLSQLSEEELNQQVNQMVVELQNAQNG